MTNSSLPKSPALAADHRLKILGGNVRRERTDRRLSQGALAKRAGLSVNTIARIEAGELRVRETTLERLRQAIGCAEKDFFRGCA